MFAGAAAISCPANSAGANVASGCTCKTGYTGTISVSSTFPYYTGSCCAVKTGYDQGGGFTQIALLTGVSSDQACFSLCAKDVRCVYWLRQPSTGTCWLSSTTPTILVTASDRNIGSMQCAREFEPHTFLKGHKPRVCLTGQSLDNVVSSLQSLQQWIDVPRGVLHPLLTRKATHGCWDPSRTPGGVKFTPHVIMINS